VSSAGFVVLWCFGAGLKNNRQRQRRGEARAVAPSARLFSARLKSGPSGVDLSAVNLRRSHSVDEILRILARAVSFVRRPALESELCFGPWEDVDGEDAGLRGRLNDVVRHHVHDRSHTTEPPRVFADWLPTIRSCWILHESSSDAVHLKGD